MKKNLKGFTLVEVLIVIIIVGILIAALLPRLTGGQARARDLSRQLQVNQVGTAIRALMAEHGTLADTGAACVTDGSEISVANGADLTSYLTVNLTDPNATTTDAFGQTSCAGVVVMVSDDGRGAVAVKTVETETAGNYASTGTTSFTTPSTLSAGMVAGTDWVGTPILQ